MPKSPDSTPRRSMPLSGRILISVTLGVLVGLVMREWSQSHPEADLATTAGALGQVGMLVIRLLKALASPLLLFAVIDAFLHTHIPKNKGFRLVSISAVNACVAIVIGLSVANLLQAGTHWQGQIPQLTATSGHADSSIASAPGATLNPLKNLAGYIPESLVEPFLKNNIITVVLLALMTGIALRRLKDRGDTDIAVVEQAVAVGLKVFSQMLEWLIQVIPLAVFAVIVQVVERTGLGVFVALGWFLVTILLGLFIHACVYYSLLLRLVAGWSPRRFFSGAIDAILFALSAGSSLATLPVTLKCLTERLGVSQASARLAACVGTNLNHDGIILYEAGAAVFVAQAWGFELGLTQQVAIAAAAVMAGIGIAGVPEAGLITLPLVLAAAGLPDSVAATALPLILPVDWIIGRCRAATNVTSDMTVAVLLDATESGLAPEARETEIGDSCSPIPALGSDEASS